MFQFDDNFGGFSGEDIHRILVSQKIGTFDSIVGVGLGIIFGVNVLQGGGDTPLGSDGVGTNWVGFGNDSNIDSRVEAFDF
jgi:hypothetical protein